MYGLVHGLLEGPLIWQSGDQVLQGLDLHRLYATQKLVDPADEMVGLLVGGRLDGLGGKELQHILTPLETLEPRARVGQGKKDARMCVRVRWEERR